MSSQETSTPSTSSFSFSSKRKDISINFEELSKKNLRQNSYGQENLVKRECLSFEDKTDQLKDKPLKNENVSNSNDSLDQVGHHGSIDSLKKACEDFAGDIDSEEEPLSKIIEKSQNIRSNSYNLRKKNSNVTYNHLFESSFDKSLVIDSDVCENEEESASPSSDEKNSDEDGKKVKNKKLKKKSDESFHRKNSDFQFQRKNIENKKYSQFNKKERIIAKNEVSSDSDDFEDKDDVGDFEEYINEKSQSQSKSDGTDDDETDEVKTSRMCSGVWKYFKRFKNEDNEEYTICQVENCQKSYRHFSSTDNMGKHLLNRHKINPDVDDPKNCSRSHLLFLFLMFILTSGSPIRIVENNYLKQLFNCLCPEFKIPCRKTIVKLIKTCYISEKKKIENKINNASSLVLTTDSWKSIQNFDYVGVTAHFVDHEFMNQSIVLTTRHLSGGKSASNISKYLKEIMQEFNIVDKVRTIVTDNVITMKNAIEKNLKLDRIPCYAHILNLMVERFFKSLVQKSGIKDDDLEDESSESNSEDEHIEDIRDEKKISNLFLKVIKKCKSIVGVFNHSPELKEKLYEVQNRKNLKNKMLITCVSTR